MVQDQAFSRARTVSGVDRKFVAIADDHELIADGADTTRIVLRVTDEFDRVRPIANDTVVFDLSGPGKIIGDNPFALTGGTGAIWIRANEQPGTIVVRAKHPRLGTQRVEIRVTPVLPELV